MAKVPVEKGKQYNIKINRLGSSGEGVGRIEGFTVFVVGGLPEEELTVKITEVKKSYATGKLVKVLKPSSDRVVPFCGIYKECGGCQLQHLSYEGQLKAKQQQVKDAVHVLVGHEADDHVKLVILFTPELPEDCFHSRGIMGRVTDDGRLLA